uniref:Uncharacterized protein n=1 Tax=Nelumbo nucifera TaxID=4432 RepID=A0A822YEQ1_NELNU|nr:TPA_asm: hypothetical protein HUJ06_011495 [Nelumbo nucifera]
MLLEPDLIRFSLSIFIVALNLLFPGNVGLICTVMRYANFLSCMLLDLQLFCIPS